MPDQSDKTTGFDKPAGGAASPVVVSLSHVTLRYPDVTALDDVTLSISEGERICVLGANGSGKSTLASVICGLLAPDEGSVMLVGQQVCGSDGIDYAAYRRARRQLGLVFQNPDDQIVTSIVEEDVAFGPENLCLPPEEIGTRVARELRRVAMTDFALRDPSHLSGGQKQRVTIAGALAMEPRVLVLDEPGALLDVRGRRGIMRVMGQLHEQGTTIVHITHFMDEALAADRVVVMDHGHVTLEGTPEEVFSHGDELTKLGLQMPFAAQLATALRERSLDVPWTCDEDALRASLRLSRPYEGGELLSSQIRARGTDPLVQVENVSYTYHDDEDDHKALNDVSFRVNRGASVAIVGQTGSGKSTLVRLLCALEAPDLGRIVINGIDTQTRRERRRLHGKVGYVMQHPERQLFAETVFEDVAYGPTNLGLPPAEIKERCTHALEVVGLVGKEAASPFQLSGGQQRLCAIAGVLAMRPKILVLDEPLAGLDPRGRLQLEHILDGIHDSGVTTIRVTHSMDDAAKAQQVIVLSKAQVLTQGSPQEVFSPTNKQVLHDAGLGLPAPLSFALSVGLETNPLTIEALVEGLVNRYAGEVA